MSDYPGLTRVIEQTIRTSDYGWMLPDAGSGLAEEIAAAVVAFATTDDAALRADHANLHVGTRPEFIPTFAEHVEVIGAGRPHIIAGKLAAIRAALGEEKTDG